MSGWADLLRVTRAERHRAKPSKYRNLETVVDGHTFDSRREARRYRELRTLERAGEIRDLELQPQFVLHAPKISPGGEVVGLLRVGSYYGDFRYRTRAGAIIVEDSKGVRTAVFKLKRRMVAAEYDIEIQEV